MSGHDWIFDVLTDLAGYAEAHGMNGLARKAREALDVARREVAMARHLDAVEDDEDKTRH